MRFEDTVGTVHCMAQYPAESKYPRPANRLNEARHSHVHGRRDRLPSQL